jgi:hypothetical protein
VLGCLVSYTWFQCALRSTLPIMPHRNSAPRRNGSLRIGPDFPHGKGVIYIDNGQYKIQITLRDCPTGRTRET